MSDAEDLERTYVLYSSTRLSSSQQEAMASVSDSDCENGSNSSSQMSSWSEGQLEIAYELYPSTEPLPFQQERLASQSPSDSENGSDSSSLISSDTGSRNGLPESDHASNNGSAIPNNGHRNGPADVSTGSANGAGHGSVVSVNGQRVTGDRNHDQGSRAVDASSQKKAKKQTKRTRAEKVTKKEHDIKTAQDQGVLDPNLVLLRGLKHLYQEKGGLLHLDTKQKRVSVNFADFARVTVERLQSILVERVLDFTYRDVLDARSAAQDLSTYVTLCKDLEYMTNAADSKALALFCLNGKEYDYDPFAISTDLTMQRDLLRDVYRRFLTKAPVSPITARAEFDQDNQFLMNELGVIDPEDGLVRVGHGTRTEHNERKEREQYARKVIMAVTGGAFLIFPMLVMVLHPGKVTSLVTTSVCVFAFGLLMSSSHALQEPFDVLSATAAYAAVLVVFIGTGGGS